MFLCVLIRELYRSQLRAAAETAEQPHRVQQAGTADLHRRVSSEVMAGADPGTNTGEAARQKRVQVLRMAQA